MVEEGVRFIVTTNDGVYITPLVTEDENSNGVMILDMSDICEPTKLLIKKESIESIVQEVYTQKDVTETIFSKIEVTV